ncbi:sugar phosphate isomerase/epimerase [candidate division KSB1 bacterium]|nr:sugar phosphate isomerase/epimerase [candidate division KSB1 bacterium]
MKIKTNRRKFLIRSLALPAMAVFASSPQKLNAQNKVKRTDGAKLKISLNAYSFNKPLNEGSMTLDDLVEYCAEQGFDAVDLTGYYFPNYPEVPADDYIYHIKRKAFINGLAISGTGIRNDFTIPDTEKRKADIQLIKNWINIAVKIGAPVIRIFTGGNVPDGYSREQTEEWMVKDIQECTEFGKEHGIMVAVQNHWDFLKTADETLNLLKKVNSDWFGLVLDIGSYRSENPYEEIARMAPYAVSWQFKENIYVNGQQTETDVNKIASILKSSGYRGYVPIETLGEGDPKIKVKALLAKVRTALMQ